MSRTVKKTRLNGLELKAEESTIVINYVQDACLMDEDGRVTSTESTPGNAIHILDLTGTNLSHCGAILDRKWHICV